MEPLKVTAGFGMGEKAPTTEKHFVVILGRATQFHLGDKPTLALEFSAFHSGMDLRMRVFSDVAASLSGRIWATP